MPLPVSLQRPVEAQPRWILGSAQHLGQLSKSKLSHPRPGCCLSRINANLQRRESSAGRSCLHTTRQATKHSSRSRCPSATQASGSSDHHSISTGAPRSRVASLLRVFKSRYDADIFRLAIPALMSILLDPVMSLVDTGETLSASRVLQGLPSALHHICMHHNHGHCLFNGLCMPSACSMSGTAVTVIMIMDTALPHHRPRVSQLLLDAHFVTSASSFRWFVYAISMQHGLLGLP